MITLIKLGGSLITDKRAENTFRPSAAAQVAAEIARARTAQPDLRLVIGHGSGSFGHVAARQHGTIAGVQTATQWLGFGQVAFVAGQLNMLMAETLYAAGVPVIRFSPSASTQARDGIIETMATLPIRLALEHGLVPLVHGDVGFDAVRGGTILSTEIVFFYLAWHLPVTRIFLLGEVDGVYGLDGAVIPTITPHTLPDVEAALGGSHGTDVTGGMETKVRDMVALTEQIAGLEIRIFSGLHAGLLETALIGQSQPGTLITGR